MSPDATRAPEPPPPPEDVQELPPGFHPRLAPAFGKGLDLGDEATSTQVATLFGEGLSPGDLVLLHGPLGAGKTHWVRGACVSLGVDCAEVTSPTYTLVHYYHGSDVVVHADLYRIPSRVLPEELGLDEDLESQETVLFVEWPEKLIGARAHRTLEVWIEILDDGRRQVRIRERERI